MKNDIKKSFPQLTIHLNSIILHCLEVAVVACTNAVTLSWKFVYSGVNIHFYINVVCCVGRVEIQIEV